jgi:class 3 adenylate cyclase
MGIEAKTRYAKSGDVHIAYRVFGDGPRDIVIVPGLVSHLEQMWEIPPNDYVLERLTSFARVIAFDKRGQGLSDRVSGVQTLEERIDDVRAVMDAAGSERAALYGMSEGGPMSLMFAASHPDRITALILYGTFAAPRATPGAATDEQFELGLKQMEAHWGEGWGVRFFAPSRLKDDAFIQSFGRLERASASPGSVLAQLRMNHEIDVRHLLPSIRVPTLILHCVGDSIVPVESGRYIAQHIPGAKYVELPGRDHIAVDREVQDRILDAVEEFLTGMRHRPEPDRVLATVMFTDIVGSTERAAELGDRRWRELLSQYYRVVRRDLAAFRGREVNTSGDGVLATFDGPARAIRCACSIRDGVRALGLQVRTGLHTGECELIGDDVGGIAVHIGARVATTAGPEEVLVSSTVKDLVAGSGLQFADRGMHNLKGVPGEWRLFVVR